MPDNSGLKLGVDDLDEILQTHAPHLAVTGQKQPFAPNVPLPAPTPVPTRGQASDESDKHFAKFQAGRPDVYGQAGAPAFYSTRIAQSEWDKAHPWGSPENHPGFLGKLGHGLATAGNIAGTVLAPAQMALIPGTDLNRRVEEAGNTRGLERAQQQETAEEAVQQRPEIAEEKGRLQGELEANRQAEADKRLQETQGGLDERQQKALDAENKRQAEREKAAEKGRQETFTHQDQLESDREAAAEARLNRTLEKTGNSRADKSYQFNSTQLEKLSKPVEDRVERIGRLQDTLNQGTPQADALVAPELLSVMAGGPASGLRMNEAEIARIVGGRTNWETIKAKIDAWHTDPNVGFALTPAQRDQVKNLFSAVQQRAATKIEAINEANQALVDTDDPKEHRQIMADLKKKLTAIDSGKEEGGTQSGTADDPLGILPPKKAKNP